MLGACNLSGRQRKLPSKYPPASICSYDDDDGRLAKHHRDTNKLEMRKYSKAQEKKKSMLLLPTGLVSLEVSCLTESRFIISQLHPIFESQDRFVLGRLVLLVCDRVVHQQAMLQRPGVLPERIFIPLILLVFGPRNCVGCFRVVLSCVPAACSPCSPSSPGRRND